MTPRCNPRAGDFVEVWAGAFGGRTDVPRASADPWLRCRVTFSDAAHLTVEYERGSLTPLRLDYASTHWRWAPADLRPVPQRSP